MLIVGYSGLSGASAIGSNRSRAVVAIACATAAAFAFAMPRATSFQPWATKRLKPRTCIPPRQRPRSSTKRTPFTSSLFALLTRSLVLIDLWGQVAAYMSSKMDINSASMSYTTGEGASIGVLWRVVIAWTKYPTGNTCFCTVQFWSMLLCTQSRCGHAKQRDEEIWLSYTDSMEFMRKQDRF